jgi:hypothetical protein
MLGHGSLEDVSGEDDAAKRVPKGMNFNARRGRRQDERSP